MSYRDEVKVGLHNESVNQIHILTHGARIAQGVYGIVIGQDAVGRKVVDTFTSTENRGGGIGHTGV